MKAQAKKYTVLFVDDETRITSALRAIFRRDYNVLTASSGKEALSILADKSVDVIVSDQRMPEMLGNELLATVSKRYPQTMRILLTGFMDKKAIIDTINEGEIYRFINKPWNNEKIQQIVAEASFASEFASSETQDDEETQTPLNQASSKESSSSHSQPIADRAIVMIEREKDVRNQMRKFCSEQDIMIYNMPNVEHAIAAATSRESIGIAIIELSENTAESIQTINLLKQARPELITIALTEEYDAHTAVDLINQGQVYKYLAKPLNIEKFQKTIQKAFRRNSFLKKNSGSVKRFKVEKTTSILSNLQGLFKQLIAD